MTPSVSLAGIVPCKDTEEVFRTCAATLCPTAKGLPDGERAADRSYPVRDVSST